MTILTLYVPGDHLKTPLHWAAEDDRHDIAKMLEHCGSAPGTWRQGDESHGGGESRETGPGSRISRSGTPLESPAWRAVPAEPDGHWVADSARMKGDLISNAFYGACRNGHTAVAAFLPDSRGRRQRKSVFGGTALHWAAINGHKETVAFLMAHGADLTIRDTKFDSTPEGWAAEGGRYALRELLRRS